VDKQNRYALFCFIPFAFKYVKNIFNASEINQKFPRKAGICSSSGGERGIRTLGTVTRTHV
jgi:hypothetical protein